MRLAVAIGLALVGGTSLLMKIFGSAPLVAWVSVALPSAIAAALAGGALVVDHHCAEAAPSSNRLRLLSATLLVIGIGASLFRFLQWGGMVWGKMAMPGFGYAKVSAWVGIFSDVITANPGSTAICLGPGVALLAVLLVDWSHLVTVPLEPWRVRRFTAALRRRKGWLPSAIINRLSSTQAGLPLGSLANRVLRYQPDAKLGLLGGHHMVIAGTRAGKGVSCVIPAIIEHDGPVVVLDIKGENFAICRRHRASLGRRQITLNPFGLIDGKTSHFNALDYLRNGPDLQRDIAVLADGLIKPIDGQGEWISNGTKEIVAAALELVATYPPPQEEGGRSLIGLETLLLGPGREAAFAAWVNAGDVCGGRVAKAGTRIATMDAKEKGYVLGCISENLSWLKYEQIRKMVGKSGFAWTDLLDSKIDLYVVVPQDMVGELGGYMRVVMNLCLGAVTRQDGKRKAKDRILAVLDEFTRLGRMQKVLDIATIAAGGGVEAMFVVQDRATLDSIYTPDGASTLLGSCATTRVFGLGRGDDKTAAWAAALMPISHVEQRHSESTQNGGGRSTSEQEQKLPLLNAGEILEMPAGTMLCLLRSKPPVLLDQIISHQHPDFFKRLDPNPTMRA